MIVSTDVLEAVGRLTPSLKLLKEVVDPLLASISQDLQGDYISARIKPLESITAKLEKDAPASLLDINDLLAATVVLTSHERILGFEAKIRQFCEVIEVKSERADNPENFAYDDRHLILKLSEDYHAVIENPVLRMYLFEVQIKTYFQNALTKWSRGAYKARKLSWNLARLVGQTRALVEMADSALARVEASLREASETVEYQKFSHHNAIIELIADRLQSVQLPEDMRRLAVTIDEDIKHYFKHPSEEERRRLLGELLEDPKNQDILGAESLTAYNVFLVALLRAKKDLVAKKDGVVVLNKPRRKHLLLTKEVLPFCPELSALGAEYRVKLESAVE
jgi:ppGpp synthetase/RelA/SpoT-type nucleotidyltranferase